MGSRGFRRTAAKYATLVIAGFLSMALMACQNSSGSTNSNLTTIDQNLRFQSVDGIAPSIPQYMMVTVPATFALNASGSVTVSNATWNFGDGTTANTAIATHTYSATGTYTVTVTATDSNGNQMSFNQAVTVVAFNEAYNCIADLSTSVPSVGTVGQAVTMTLNVPSCMTGEITTTDWNFGDNSTGSGTSVTHTFTTAGVYTVNTAIYIFDGTTPSFTVTATISITGGNSTSGGGSTSGSGSGSTSGSGTGSNNGGSSNPGTGNTGSNSNGNTNTTSITPPPSVPLSPAQLADLSILVLNPAYSGALNLSGNASIKAAGSVIVNSMSNSAVVLSGSALLQGSQVNVTGNIVTSGGASVSGPIATGVNPTLDPFANLAAPSSANLTSYSDGRISGDKTVTLQPGDYASGISVSGNSTVTLSSGTYFIDNGISVSGGSTLVGKNVFLYIDSGSISFSGGSNVTLSPVSCGTTSSGITIFQSRTNAMPASLSGNANGTISGVLYFPDAEVNLSGGAGVPQPFTLIANTLGLSGGSFIVGTALNCSAGTGK